MVYEGRRKDSPVVEGFSYQRKWWGCLIVAWHVYLVALCRLNASPAPVYLCECRRTPPSKFGMFQIVSFFVSR